MRALTIIFLANVSIHPRCTLCTVGVECLVGFHLYRLFLASLSEIVPVWFVTFASSVVEVPLCARQLIIPDPTFYRSMLSFAGEKPAFGSQG